MYRYLFTGHCMELWERQLTTRLCKRVKRVTQQTHPIVTENRDVCVCVGDDGGRFFVTISISRIP